MIFYSLRMKQITVYYHFFSPRVSTVGSFLTIALRLAIRMTPSAKVTVTTIGKPSGIAATAKLLANNISQSKLVRIVHLVHYKFALLFFLQDNNLQRHVFQKRFFEFYTFLEKIILRYFISLIV